MMDQQAQLLAALGAVATLIPLAQVVQAMPRHSHSAVVDVQSAVDCVATSAQNAFNSNTPRRVAPQRRTSWHTRADRDDDHSLSKRRKVIETSSTVSNSGLRKIAVSNVPKPSPLSRQHQRAMGHHRAAGRSRDLVTPVLKTTPCRPSMDLALPTLRSHSPLATSETVLLTNPSSASLPGVGDQNNSFIDERAKSRQYVKQQSQVDERGNPSSTFATSTPPVPRPGQKEPSLGRGQLRNETYRPNIFDQVPDLPPSSEPGPMILSDFDRTANVTALNRQPEFLGVSPTPPATMQEFRQLNAARRKKRAFQWTSCGAIACRRRRPILSKTDVLLFVIADSTQIVIPFGPMTRPAPLLSGTAPDSFLPTMTAQAIPSSSRNASDEDAMCVSPSPRYPAFGSLGNSGQFYPGCSPGTLLGPLECAMPSQPFLSSAYWTHIAYPSSSKGDRVRSTKRGLSFRCYQPR